MFTTIRTVRTLAALAVGTALLAAPLSASAQMRLQAPQGPQSGQCRAAAVIVVGLSAGAVQQIWASAVTAQLGPKWSLWAGAKNKAVLPTGGQGASSWQAVAIPCYYEPVL